ncbi:DNA topoisomerase I, mitochondrial-like isoform X4 [Carcharodon carcharias]|uniref:DNA topoisomerase I, mitochondrial-like isoform X4 n=1 Tax=Carcharodon carcharias TaxID=13397 RepID=UPI001B7EEDA3|nr:DNA topoisomerase I, mitochondrial-like isoform X4 [Carcharodon carcharias]
MMNGAVTLTSTEGVRLPQEPGSSLCELNNAILKDEEKDKKVTKSNKSNKDEKNKNSKHNSPSLPKTEREPSHRKRKNNLAGNNLNKKHKEDTSEMQINKEVKIEQKESYDATEKKVKGNLLKRSTCQESFEDMLMGMDEQLKEFCARKQKNKDRKHKEREKTNSSNKPQDKEENNLGSSNDKLKKPKLEETEEDDEIPQTSSACMAARRNSEKLKKKLKVTIEEKEGKQKLRKGEKSKTQLKEEEEKKREAEKWKWWEEEHYEDGVKWMFLEHQGPLFAAEYEPLPFGVDFYYNGDHMKLSLAAEEVATFYAKMLDHEYTSKEVFRQNFFHDWQKEMNEQERMMITDLNKCDFTQLHKYFTEKAEAKKALPKEEKQKLKLEQDAITEIYGYCVMDGHRERIANFKIEPPGLFRGRGDHPKMGKLKKRIMPEDVIINCSKDSKIPEPPENHQWKEVRFDNKVTWLASWTENVQGLLKYIMLNPSSKLKGEKDWQKYEVARRLKDKIDAIRSQYRIDWKSREMKSRQRAVALYFIDKLALRAGNEKEEGETADTVGCCSLRVEHIKLHDNDGGQQCVVEFDFLGKDSIRYYNKVPVEKQVFKNLKLFMENKDPNDDLFDRLNTSDLNKHLQELMEGLTAKVFRTYNASITLQEQLAELTDPEESIAEKILSYNRANRAVAVLCNHQRTPPKTFEKSMKNIQSKIEAKKEQLAVAKKDLKNAKVDYKVKKDEKSKQLVEKKKKLLQRLEEQLMKLEVQATDREENKQIALGTSKLNYLDPRITVAWCKKWHVPIEKVYNKTQREKFAWAIDMTDENFEF